MPRTPSRSATVGVAEHGNTAVLVTLSADRELLDRRRVELTHGLPTHPYHHEGAWAMGRYLDSPWARPISLADAIALVERVHEAAARGAQAALESLAGDLPEAVAAVAIRSCPPLPATIEERIADNRAQVVADSVMYRQALAAAATARGWRVHWYERDRAMEDAGAVHRDVKALLAGIGKAAGPPWQAGHKLAAVAALAAMRPAVVSKAGRR